MTTTAPLPRPDGGSLIARGASMPWQDAGSPGFWVKPLFEDPASGERTLLMKADPGATSSPHAHDDEIEQIYVLEGGFNDDEASYGPGDFVVRDAGAIHSTTCEAGALMLLIYSKVD